VKSPSSGILPEGATAPSEQNPTSSQPVHRGIWQKIKDFFGSYKPPLCSPYPKTCYGCDPYGGLQNILIAQMAMTTLSTCMMMGMMRPPMMYYYYPVFPPFFPF